MNVFEVHPTKSNIVNDHGCKEKSGKWDLLPKTETYKGLLSRRAGHGNAIKFDNVQIKDRAHYNILQLNTFVPDIVDRLDVLPKP